MKASEYSVKFLRDGPIKAVGSGAMDFEYSIDTEENLIRLRCAGSFRMEDLINAMKEVYSDPKFCSGMNVVGDYSAAEWVGDPEEMSDYMEFSDKIKHQRGEYRSAVLLADEEGYGLVKMFNMLSKQRGIGMETKGFMREEDALVWLRDGKKSSPE